MTIQPTDNQLAEALPDLPPPFEHGTAHGFRMTHYYSAEQMRNYALAALRTARHATPASASEAVPVEWHDPYADTDQEVIEKFLSVCRNQKPVGQWPGERVCAAIERLQANQKPFRFIAEADMSPERGHNGRGGDEDRPLSGPRHPAPVSGEGQQGESLDEMVSAPEPVIAERVLAELLPHTYYLDPPDGGNVSILEQLHRQAKDAERYRLLRRKVCIVGASFHIVNARPTYVAPDPAAELDASLDALLGSEATQQQAGQAVVEVSAETFNDDGTSDIIKSALPIGTKLYATQQTPEGYVPPGWLDRARAAADFSHNFATAKPNINDTEQTHILGLCRLIQELIAASEASGRENAA